MAQQLTRKDPKGQYDSYEKTIVRNSHIFRQHCNHCKFITSAGQPSSHSSTRISATYLPTSVTFETLL